MNKKKSAFVIYFVICTKFGGWLLISYQLYIYLAEFEIIKTHHVIVTIISFLSTMIYWFAWAKPKLNLGRIAPVLAPLIIIMLFSIFIYWLGWSCGSLKWLPCNLAAGLLATTTGYFFEKELLSKNLL